MDILLYNMTHSRRKDQKAEKMIKKNGRQTGGLHIKEGLKEAKGGFIEENKSGWEGVWIVKISSGGRW